MKKIIAVSVALALAAGSVFAQESTNIRWRGLVYVGLNALQGGNGHGMTGYEDPESTATYPDNLSSALVGRGSYTFGRIWVDASRVTDVGTFGAMWRLTASGQGGWSAPTMDGHVWWRANEMFRMALGGDIRGVTGGSATDFIWPDPTDTWGGLDGGFADGFTYFDGDGEGGSALSTRTAFQAWGGGGANPNLGFQITPMGDLLHINVILPYLWWSWQRGEVPPVAIQPGRSIENVLRGVIARTYVNLDGIGRIGVGYHGGRKLEMHTDLMSQGTIDLQFNAIWGEAVGGSFTPGSVTPTSGMKVTDTTLGNIFAFYRNATFVDNLDLRLGVRFGLPRSWEMEQEGQATVSGTHASQLAFGLSTYYSMGAFNIKVNAAAQLLLGGEETVVGGSVFADTRSSYLRDATRMSFEVVPAFGLSSNVELNLVTALGVDMAGSNYGDANYSLAPHVWWGAAPLVCVFTPVGNFTAGFRIWGNNGSSTTASGDWENPELNWAVPIGFVFVW